MKCSRCGSSIDSSNKFCPNCGNLIDSNREIEILTDKGPTKKKKIVWIFIAVLLLIGVGLGVFIGPKLFQNHSKEKDTIVEGDSSKWEDVSYEEKTYNLFHTDMSITMDKKTSSTHQINGMDEELSKNIEIYGIYHSHGNSVYIYGKNKNTSDVVVNATIYFYDKNGKQIESRYVNYSVRANSEFVLDIYIIDDSYQYESTNLVYSASKERSYYTEIDSKYLEFKTFIDKKYEYSRDEVNYIVHNKYSEKLFAARLGCVYYKNGKVVFAVDGYLSDIEPNVDTTSSFYYSLLAKDDTFEHYIEYDDYKAFLYSAYLYSGEDY